MSKTHYPVGTKIFTPEHGKYQTHMPIDWEYKNPSMFKNQNAPDAFGHYDEMLAAFQLSCKLVTPSIEDLIRTKNLYIHSSGSKLEFSEHCTRADNLVTYLWICAVDDHFVMATFIYETDHENDPRIVYELAEARNMLKNFLFVKPQYRPVIIAQRRYGLFMGAMAAAMDLRNKALDNGSFIETIILTANRIDGLLRLAMILQKQIREANDTIDTTYIFQDETDKPVMERTIYKLTLDEGIITQKQFDSLDLLYKERNKVVHRYIITDIRTEDVLTISYDYYQIEDEIDSIVNDLEFQQYTSKIGLHKGERPPADKLNGEQIKRLLNTIRDKHGNINWQKEKNS